MLKDQIDHDIKAAMRARDQARLRTLRAIKTALIEREIEERRGGDATLTGEQELVVLQKQAKQRRDAIAQYEEAGRTDLATKEQEELEIIEAYLPGQLSDDEIRAIIHEVIAATGAASPRDLGKVMGVAIKRMRGQADGRRINEIARSLLTG